MKVLEPEKLVTSIFKSHKRFKTPSTRSRVMFKYDDVMPRFKARSSAHTIQKRYVWTEIFLDTEKKISVFENTQLRVDSQITIQKRYVWT